MTPTDPFHTDYVTTKQFQIVGPVQKITVECNCGCGVLSEAVFNGGLWVAAHDDGLFFGVPKGFRTWLFRTLSALRPAPRGMIRIVELRNGARLMVTDKRTFLKMAKPPKGTRSEPQDRIDSCAGFFLMQPPPGAPILGYTGPLVPADPPRIPRIQLLFVAPGAWTLTA